MRSGLPTSRCALQVPGVGPGRAARYPGRPLACSWRPPPPFLSDRFCSLALGQLDSQVGKRVGLFTRLLASNRVASHRRPK